MKRMVYVIIAATALVVIGAIVAGCSTTPAKKSEPQLEGISFYQNHMNYGYCYSFYLREESDNKVLLDAEVRFDEEPYCIILESCEVDKSELENLRNLDKQYSVASYVSTYKKQKSPFEVSDETVNKTTVYFLDGTDKTADTKQEHIDVLYDFFFDLAMKYADKSVYVQ